MKSLKLATSICSCPEVDAALGNKSHPCHRVVSVQDEMVATDAKMRQRPEPWSGDIETAKGIIERIDPLGANVQLFELITIYHLFAF